MQVSLRTLVHVSSHIQAHISQRAPTNFLIKRFFQGLFFSGVIATAAYAGELAAGEVEDVLVTASRFPEPGMVLPLSYSAVSSEAIDLVSAVHANEIMARVPGAWLSRGNGQESLVALRSQVFTGAGGCGSVLMAADGISLRAPGFCNVNQLFYAHTEQAGRIEVIHGPATSSYGSNAMHGVINVLTYVPEEKSDHATLALTAGPHDYRRVGVRMTSEHGFGLRATGISDGGYLQDSGYDQQKLNVFHRYEGNDWQFDSVLAGTNLNQETAGFIKGFQAFKDDTLRKTNPNPEAYRDTWSLRAHTRMIGKLSDDKILQLTPYIRSNKMEFMQHFLPWKAIEKNGHDSVGMQSLLKIELSNLQIKTGLDIDLTRGWLEEFQPEPFSANQPQGIHYDFRVDAKTSALFSQLEWQAGERWLLSAGTRFEYTSYDYDNGTGDGSACLPAATNCRFFRPADRRDHFDNWSVNLGASYEFAAGQYVFLRFADGFRAPETNELYRLQAGQQVAELSSESVENIELGLRGNVASRLRYRLAAYRMNKTDVIFQDADRYNVTGARTRHRGVEVELDYYLQEYWYTGASFAFARHRYANDAPLLGVNASISGNDIDTAPRHFGSARLGYDDQSLQVEMEWVHMGRYYLEPENKASYPGHDLFNVRLAKQFTSLVGGALRVTNLFNQRYAERADFGFGDYRYFVGESRAVYAEINLSLGGE